MSLFKHTSKIICIAVLCRLFGVLTQGQPLESVHRIMQFGVKSQMEAVLLVNNDEMLIAEVAINHRYGLGYASSKEVKRAGYIYDFTAYRPTYPVYLHLALQSFYLAVFPERDIKLDKTDPYFIGFAFLIHLVSISLFIFSLSYFRKLALIFLDETWANAALLFYALYPSVMLFVGNYANYESITTSLLIICMYTATMSLQRSLTTKELTWFFIYFLVSVLFRPQLNFIFLFIFGVQLVITFIMRKLQKPLFIQAARMTIIAVSVYVLFNIPVLVKNYRLFNGVTLATTGFNFSLGHNPYARGGWCGNCFVNKDGEFYHYIREEIPGYEAMNEYEKTNHLTSLAFNWMIHHPLQEMMLDIKKVAIYFLPYNNDHEVFNVLNLVVHLGAITFFILVFWMLIFKRKYDPSSLLLLCPMLGSLMITVMFHAGYRWRYYAEPFMVIMTIIVIEKATKMWQDRKRQVA